MEKIVIGDVAVIEEDNAVSSSSTYIIRRKCYFAIKRLFDIVCSLILLPLVLIITLLVKIA